MRGLSWGGGGGGGGGGFLFFNNFPTSKAKAIEVCLTECSLKKVNDES